LEEPESSGTVPKAQEATPEPTDGMVTQFDSTTTEREAQKRRGKLRFLREIIETVVLTVIIFAVINTLTGRFRIEGPSMMPNLHEGQYLIINKVVYRLGSPQRGDIIVFHHPQNSNRDLIKRIIGLPGETVEIRHGEVYVNGTLLEEPYVLQQGGYSGRYELGPDEFFVLGDNRPNSDDSHNWGVLPRDRIVGKAAISYWPPAAWGGAPHFSYANGLTPEGGG
jgi:signal peptidase I